jgi:hypothetical protein
VSRGIFKSLSEENSPLQSVMRSSNSDDCIDVIINTVRVSVRHVRGGRIRCKWHHPCNRANSGPGSSDHDQTFMTCSTATLQRNPPTSSPTCSRVQPTLPQSPTKRIEQSESRTATPPTSCRRGHVSPYPHRRPRPMCRHLDHPLPALA